MSSPPPEAYDVARSLLAIAYTHRDLGITYGGVDVGTEPVFEGRMQAHLDLANGSAGAGLCAWLNRAMRAGWRRTAARTSCRRRGALQWEPGVA